ncbi:hypothetical protein [Streptomyces roseifaciens]|nr:hypothetical protein [Streptomyces roseifaciens]
MQDEAAGHGRQVSGEGVPTAGGELAKGPVILRQLGAGTGLSR